MTNHRPSIDLNSVDVPKSTLVVGGALYAILCGLMTWNLVTTINIKDKQSEDMQGVRVEQAMTSGRISILESRVNLLETRPH